MNRILLVFLALLFGLSTFAQSRRSSTTLSNASQRQSVDIFARESYEPVYLKLGKVLEVENGVAYARINQKYIGNRDGEYYFYACNLKSEITAMLSFGAEAYMDIFAMDIFDGNCEKGDYVYMRFVPKSPEGENL